MDMWREQVSKTIVLQVTVLDVQPFWTSLQVYHTDKLMFYTQQPLIKIAILLHSRMTGIELFALGYE